MRPESRVRGAGDSGTHASGVPFREAIRSTPEACVPTQKTAGLITPGGFRLPDNTGNRLATQAFELVLAAQVSPLTHNRPALETATEQVQYD